MKKKWYNIGDALDNATQVTLDLFKLELHDTVVFEGNRVYNTLTDFYSDWSIYAKETNAPINSILMMFQDYTYAVGENYYRMWDALNREYNPINNYAMVESGVDGRKVSAKTINDEHGKIDATKNDIIDVSTHSENTTTVNQTTEDDTTLDNYRNAFDSVDAQGTHTDKSVTDSSNTVTGTGTDNSVSGNVTNYQNSLTDEFDGNQYNGYNKITKENENHTQSEQFGNDVSLHYNKSNPNGSYSPVEMGNDYTDGTIHELTRAGNIGVTTSAQMITGELEMRKVNLLKEFVDGFVMRYCSYLRMEE